MWDKLKTIIVTVLATLGVVFIVILLIPDDEEEEAVTQPQQIQEVQDTAGETFSSHVQETAQAQENTVQNEPAEEQEALHEQQAVEDTTAESNVAGVSIPESEISDNALRFKTITLDGQTVDQDIFSGYDITVVHVWGTYCGPCISEMGEYARAYKNLPDNVNLIGIVVDVYEGLDNNVDYANSILSEVGAEFINLQLSDSMYDIARDIPAIPSSFFVDSEGHIIGEKMIGAPCNATMSRLYGYLK
jgi:thiol-disulfide isomerase/thioredoxin